jgi:hypothetical protein
MRFMLDLPLPGGMPGCRRSDDVVGGQHRAEVNVRRTRQRQRQAAHVAAAGRERPVRDHDIPDRQIIAQPAGPTQQRQAARPRTALEFRAELGGPAGAHAAHPQRHGQAARSHDCLNDAILAGRRHDEKEIRHDPSMA